ncbi:hypothetical protein UA08_06037 [Talaromyces atroroseus]|uniref:Endo-arabinase n=1 Tax=Talaromyces atroroseus TaxID=1441469 RepID=A0A225AWA0_TALAT|nr:hypothetical protein UA08_06037 [Talaromyces atroroseus]OKL58715.1 hypothetical protein UA08_06037 [Talaromyces atroroseus]
MRLSLSLAILGGLSLIPTACSSPLLLQTPETTSSYTKKRASNDYGFDSVALALNTDFPDPAFVQHTNGSWYAFGTNGNGERIQVAYSADFKSWSLLSGVEALPTLSGWETEVDHWAPDVFRRNDGKYVMYYSAIAQENTNRHCIGVAIADGDSPAGPYIPTSDSPLACPLDQGGAIDASNFQDEDGTRYVLYKVDGNSVGHGGDCNNSQEPLVPTPIMIQQVKEDGLTPVGDAIQILDRDESDGPLVEAPSLVRSDDGMYLLFYSTHCFTDVKYDVRYATASTVTGPYTKKGNSLLASNDALYGPGGATVHGSGNILFHGWCNDNSVRCMYAAHVDIDGGAVTVE